MEPVPEELKLAHLYLVSSSDATQVGRQRDEYRDKLKPWIMESFNPDSDGNYYYEFPKPIQIDGIWYTGLKVQRRVSEYIDDDKAIEIINSHGLHDRCLIKKVTYDVNYDQFYAANQEGKISDDEVDSIIDFEESFALVKVKK